jgi:hypothetical protein
MHESNVIQIFDITTLMTSLDLDARLAHGV